MFGKSKKAICQVAAIQVVMKTVVDAKQNSGCYSFWGSVKVNTISPYKTS